MIRYDVLGVSLETNRVRLMATNKDEGNADAFVNQAVARRGVDEEFFVAVVAGQYQNGDEWAGQDRPGQTA